MPIRPSVIRCARYNNPPRNICVDTCIAWVKERGSIFPIYNTQLFDNLRNSIEAWMDDFTVRAKIKKALLIQLDSFFKICDVYNLNLSAKKCRLYTSNVKWCERTKDDSGYPLDPRIIEAIRIMDSPINAAELCQFNYFCRWMKNKIPDFHRRVEPLKNILEKLCKQTGKRKKHIKKRFIKQTVLEH